MMCDCEQAQQSVHSPGLVEDCENIIYCLIDPDLIDRDTAELKNKAFSKTELRKTALSVVRKPYSSGDEVQSKVIDPQIARSPNRHFCGVFICQVAQIRAIDGNTEQDICVADAGLEEFISHAHLGFCDEVARRSKSVQEAVRSNLVATFQRDGIQNLRETFEN